MSIYVDRYSDPLHPVLLPDHLDKLNIHDSPPPTLAARFALQQQAALSASASASGSASASVSGRTPLSAEMFRDPSGSAGSGDPRDVRDEDRRTPPEEEMDPRDTLETFIQHLLSPSHGDSDPHLIAIGYELEALLAIYPSLKLVMSNGTSSRPTSIAGSVSLAKSSSARGDQSRSSSKPRAAAVDGVEVTDASAEAKRTSQLWNDAVFDSSIWTPGERIRYEVSIPLWEDGEILPGLESGGGAKGKGGGGKATATAMPKGPAPMMRVLVSLPPTYPDRMAPQLQLLGRYLGDFGIDAGLFGDITRTYISTSGSPFTPGDVCVFEGLTYARGVAQEWYAARLSEGLEGEKARDEERRRGREGRAMGESYPTSPARNTFEGVWSTSHDSNDHYGEGHGSGSAGKKLQQDGGLKVGADDIPRRPSPRPTFSYSRPSPDSGDGTAEGGASASAGLSGNRKDRPSHLHASGTNGNGNGHAAPPPNVAAAQETGHFPHFTIHISQPIVDRKSTFIGHAIRVADEREVPLVIHEILSDKKVAKAAHPAMFAYRVVRDVGGVAGRVVAADCDDDGETAAGSRLAHLLDILELENVLVVVSRWYGGVHLGSDRFKHINQAARDALEVGGFLGKDKDKDGGGGGGKGRRK